MLEQLIIDINLLPSLAIRIDINEDIYTQLWNIAKNLSQSKGTRHSAKFILAAYGLLPIGDDSDESDFKIDKHGSRYYSEWEDEWHLDREHLAAVKAIKFYHRKLKSPYL